jgi:general secretion pathway protein L
MSGGRFLLLFLEEGEASAGWMRVVDGVVVARGLDVHTIAPSIREHVDADHVVLVAPGVDVVLHWVELPALTPAQARAAARLMAADLTAAPIERLHVALGRPEGELALRCLAIVDTERMERWITWAQSLGFDPDHIVPEPLLIPAPVEGTWRFELEGIHLVRAETLAFAGEPELARAIGGNGTIHSINAAGFEAGLGDALTNMSIDLRQGSFAKRRRWLIDRKLVRRLAVLTAALVLVTLLIQCALILRYGIDADRLDGQIEVAARSALPGAGEMPNPSAQLAERLADLRGGGLGFGTTAAMVFEAVRETANLELGALQFDPDGRLQATVLAADTAEFGALVQRLRARGMAAEIGPERAGGGRRIAELVVSAR